MDMSEREAAGDGAARCVGSRSGGGCRHCLEVARRAYGEDFHISNGGLARVRIDGIGEEGKVRAPVVSNRLRRNLNAYQGRPMV